MSELPPGWAEARLADFCDVTQGQSPPGSTYNYEGRGLPFFQGKADFGPTNPIPRVWCERPNKMALAGNVLISIRAPVGPTNVATQTCGIGRGLAAIHPLSQIETSFVLHAVRLHEHTLQAVSTGSTFAAISGSQLRDLKILLPPLSEQRRIIAEVEKQLTRLDEIAGLLNSVVRKSQRLKTVVVRHELGGDFPKKPLRDIAFLKGGLTMHKDRPDLKRCSPVPYLRVANVQRGFLSLGVMKTIMATPEEIADLSLQLGDVLLNEGGDRDKLGRGWIWQGEIPQCIHQNHVFRARLRGPVLPKWVSYYANEMGQRYFEREGSQTTNLASINITKLGLLPVPIAPLEEQEKILGKIDRGLSECEHLEKSIGQAQAHAARLRQSILAKAFSGQLVPHDPTDEPASVLLERIRAGRSASGAPRPRRRPARKRSK